MAVGELPCGVPWVAECRGVLVCLCDDDTSDVLLPTPPAPDPEPEGGLLIGPAAAAAAAAAAALYWPARGVVPMDRADHAPCSPPSSRRGVLDASSGRGVLPLPPLGLLSPLGAAYVSEKSS